VNKNNEPKNIYIYNILLSILLNLNFLNVYYFYDAFNERSQNWSRNIF